MTGTPERNGVATGGHTSACMSGEGKGVKMKNICIFVTLHMAFFLVGTNGFGTCFVT